MNRSSNGFGVQLKDLREAVIGSVIGIALDGGKAWKNVSWGKMETLFP